jgi:hypothetical protein
MIQPIKVGNVTIPITQRGDGRFWVRFRENGKPVRRPYRKIEKAKAQARIIATRLANNQPSLESFTAADREIYRHADTIASKHGQSLVGALTAWAQIQQAASSRKRQTVPDLVEMLIASKQPLKLSERRMREFTWLRDNFAKTFTGYIDEVVAVGPAGDLTLESYYRGRGVEDRRYNNIRDIVVTLFLFAKEHGFLPADKITEAEKVKRIDLEHGAPKIYTPAQLRVIIEHVSPDWLDWVCCQAFEGIRPEEAGKPHVSRKDGCARKLMWTDFMWDERQIRIVAQISKTGRDRYVTMNDTFIAWCGHRRDATGPVCKLDHPDRETERLGKLLGFEWINDGLRHSYASYWQSLHKNMATLKEEMGNSEPVNRRYYYHPQPAKIAKKWWEVLPSLYGTGKLIQIPLGLAAA